MASEAAFAEVGPGDNAIDLACVEVRGRLYGLEVSQIREIVRSQEVTPLPKAPKGVLVAATGKLPPPLQRLRPSVLAGDGAEPQLRIMFPPNGACLEMASDGTGKPDPIALKVTGGSEPLTVLVNGAPLPETTGRRTFFFEPDGPGFVRLTVIDGRGATDSVVVRLQ